MLSVNKGGRLDIHKRYYARQRFKLLIHETDGVEFERLFSKVMNYRRKSFTQVKPQGRFGDRKNDGFDHSNGEYFQVYSPEDPKTPASRVAAVKKAKEDFKGLCDYWQSICPIRIYRFVFNDKFRGSFPEIERTLAKISNLHSLECSSFLAHHLEDDLFALEEDQIASVIGPLIGDPATIENLDYEIVAEVVNYILQLGADIDADGELKVPDFDAKLAFNGISKRAADYLRVGSYQVGSLSEYFARSSAESKTQIRDVLNLIYTEERSRITSTVDTDGPMPGDRIFFSVLSRIIPPGQLNLPAQSAAVVLLAYFFETCDIFEDPDG